MKIRQRGIIRKTFTALLSTTFALVLQSSSFGQLDQWGYWENGVTESWWLASADFSKEEAINAVARWKSIGISNEKETAAGRAGDYFMGSDTHGTYLRWSPQEGFLIAKVDKCQAKVMGVIYGKVEVSPTLIRFLPEFRKAAQKSHGHSHSKEREPAVISFVPVKWRGELLIISEDEITDFADYVAGLGAYNGLTEFDLDISHFFYKRDPKDVVAGDIPVVPSQYERFIKKPITSTITAVGNRRLKRNYSYSFSSKIMSFSKQHEVASLTFVTVNSGIDQGAKPGLFLRVSTPNLGETVRLLHVGKTSSRGVVIRDVNNQGKETYYDNESQRERSYPKVAAGWELTTLQAH